MKKILFTIFLAVAAMNINAQLVVDSLGRVGIGTEAPKSLLAVGTSGDNDTAIKFNANGKEYGLFVNNITDNTSGISGGHFRVSNSTGSCYG